MLKERFNLKEKTKRRAANGMVTELTSSGLVVDQNDTFKDLTVCFMCPFPGNQLMMNMSTYSLTQFLLYLFKFLLCFML